MAVKLEDKTNVEAPNASFPYGNIKDNTGSGDGTPVNKAVYADLHQFLARILGLSSVVANGLPESEDDGFQYFEALQDLFVQKIAGEANLVTKVIEIGDWDMDTIPGVILSHGVGDFNKIRDVRVIIREDGGLINYPLDTTSSIGSGLGGVQGGVGSISSTDISLGRETGGGFDDPSFSTTPFNRGWVMITYEE